MTNKEQIRYESFKSPITGETLYKPVPAPEHSLVELVADFLVDYARRVKNHKADLPEAESLSLLALLDSHGVRQLDEDQTLPITPRISRFYDGDYAYKLGVENTVKAGFAKFHRLMEG